MLVQVTPWETTRTSIRLTVKSSSGKRQRKRGRSAGEDVDIISTSNCSSVAASFVSTASKRSLSKLKARSIEFDGFLPLLTMTTDHHISVIGKDSSSRVNDYEDSTEDYSPSIYRQFKNLQYYSRPGILGSFFNKTCLNGRDQHACILPQISALLDLKNDLAYALQNGNKRLCCWNIWEGSGPDDKLAMKVDLSSPAVSLSLLDLNKGMAYGTCVDGAVFVAKVVFVGNLGEKPETTKSSLSSASSLHELSVDYLPTRQSDGELHIGTCAEMNRHKTMGNGRKRKLSDGRGCSDVSFYQAFCDRKSIKIIRHNVGITSIISKVGLSIDEEKPQVATVLSLPVGDEKLCLKRAELLVSAPGPTPKVALLYTVISESTATIKDDNVWRYRGTFCTLLSLSKGCFSQNPVRMMSDAKQFGMVTETIVASASIETIRLHDLTTGSLLWQKPIKRAGPSLSDEWLLRCDSKSASMALLHFDEDSQLFVSMASVSFVCNIKDFGELNVKASAKLAGFVLASKQRENFAKASTDIQHNKSFANENMQDTVATALAALYDCIHEGSSSSFREMFNTYVSRLSGNETITETLAEHGGENDGNGEILQSNPQDPANTSQKYTDRLLCQKQSNGMIVKKFEDKTPKTRRKRFDKWRLPELSSRLPQSFIDGAVRIAVGVIRCTATQDERLSDLDVDARFVFKALIRTGRVSARTHFEGPYPLQETKKKHPLYIVLGAIHHTSKDNPLTAMELVVEMIQHCSDISERQLVVLMNYTMRLPGADDIARAFADSTAMEIQQILRVGDTDYISICKKWLKQNSFVQQSSKDKIGRKLVVAGVELVLYMILCYSECNEVMLRVALAEGLTLPAEAIVLAHLLSIMLESTPFNASSSQRKNLNFVRTTCQWIACLCDSYEDELKEARTVSGVDYLTSLKKSVQRATRNSQAIMTLKDGIRVAEAATNTTGSTSKTAMEDNQWPVEEDLPGYVIDRLTF